MRSWACKGSAQIHSCQPLQQNRKCRRRHSESGTNVVPRQVAMEEDTDQQATAGVPSVRKGIIRSQKRKLWRQALRANEAASGATALQSPVARRVGPKRQKSSNGTLPEGIRSPKRPKTVRWPANT